MPGWVKALLDDWLQAAELTAGKLFRQVNKNGKAWGESLTEKAVWNVVREYARKAGIERLAPHDQEDMCSAVPRCGRRTGADPVPARTHLDPDDRATPRLQAVHSVRSE
jgi:hypothetical protein